MFKIEMPCKSFLLTQHHTRLVPALFDPAVREIIDATSHRKFGDTPIVARAKDFRNLIAGLDQCVVLYDERKHPNCRYMIEEFMLARRDDTATASDLLRTALQARRLRPDRRQIEREISRHGAFLHDVSAHDREGHEADNFIRYRIEGRGQPREFGTLRHIQDHLNSMAWHRAL